MRPAPRFAQIANHQLDDNKNPDKKKNLCTWLPEDSLEVGANVLFYDEDEEEEKMGELVEIVQDEDYIENNKYIIKYGNAHFTKKFGEVWADIKNTGKCIDNLDFTAGGTYKQWLGNVFRNSGSQRQAQRAKIMNYFSERVKLREVIAEQKVTHRTQYKGHTREERFVILQYIVGRIRDKLEEYMRDIATDCVELITKQRASHLELGSAGDALGAAAGVAAGLHVTGAIGGGQRGGAYDKVTMTAMCKRNGNFNLFYDLYKLVRDMYPIGIRQPGGESLFRLKAGESFAIKPKGDGIDSKELLRIGDTIEIWNLPEGKYKRAKIKNRFEDTAAVPSERLKFVVSYLDDDGREEKKTEIITNQLVGATAISDEQGEGLVEGMDIEDQEAELQAGQTAVTIGGGLRGGAEVLTRKTKSEFKKWQYVKKRTARDGKIYKIVGGDIASQKGLTLKKKDGKEVFGAEAAELEHVHVGWDDPEAFYLEGEPVIVWGGGIWNRELFSAAHMKNENIRGRIVTSVSSRRRKGTTYANIATKPKPKPKQPEPKQPEPKQPKPKQPEPKQPRPEQPAQPAPPQPGPEQPKQPTEPPRLSSCAKCEPFLKYRKKKKVCEVLEGAPDNCLNLVTANVKEEKCDCNKKGGGAHEIGWQPLFDEQKCKSTDSDCPLTRAGFEFLKDEVYGLEDWGVKMLAAYVRNLIKEDDELTVAKCINFPSSPYYRRDGTDKWKGAVVRLDSKKYWNFVKTEAKEFKEQEAKAREERVAREVSAVSNAKVAYDNALLAGVRDVVDAAAEALKKVTKNLMDQNKAYSPTTEEKRRWRKAAKDAALAANKENAFPLRIPKWVLLNIIFMHQKYQRMEQRFMQKKNNTPPAWRPLTQASHKNCWKLLDLYEMRDIQKLDIFKGNVKFENRRIIIDDKCITGLNYPKCDISGTECYVPKLQRDMDEALKDVSNGSLEGDDRPSWIKAWDAEEYSTDAEAAVALKKTLDDAQNWAARREILCRKMADSSDCEEQRLSSQGLKDKILRLKSISNAVEVNNLQLAHLAIEAIPTAATTTLAREYNLDTAMPVTEPELLHAQEEGQEIRDASQNPALDEENLEDNLNNNMKILENNYRQVAMGTRVLEQIKRNKNNKDKRKDALTDIYIKQLRITDTAEKIQKEIQDQMWDDISRELSDSIGELAGNRKEMLKLLEKHNLFIDWISSIEHRFTERNEPTIDRIVQMENLLEAIMALRKKQIAENSTTIKEYIDKVNKKEMAKALGFGNETVGKLMQKGKKKFIKKFFRSYIQGQMENLTGDAEGPKDKYAAGDKGAIADKTHADYNIGKGKVWGDRSGEEWQKGIMAIDKWGDLPGDISSDVQGMGESKAALVEGAKNTAAGLAAFGICVALTAATGGVAAPFMVAIWKLGILEWGLKKTATVANQALKHASSSEKSMTAERINNVEREVIADQSVVDQWTATFKIMNMGHKKITKKRLQRGMWGAQEVALEKKLVPQRAKCVQKGSALIDIFCYSILNDHGKIMFDSKKDFQKRQFSLQSDAGKSIVKKKRKWGDVWDVIGPYYEKMLEEREEQVQNMVEALFSDADERKAVMQSHWFAKPTEDGGWGRALSETRSYLENYIWNKIYTSNERQQAERKIHKEIEKMLSSERMKDIFTKIILDKAATKAGRAEFQVKEGDGAEAEKKWRKLKSANTAEATEWWKTHFDVRRDQRKVQGDLLNRFRGNKVLERWWTDDVKMLPITKINEIYNALRKLQEKEKSDCRTAWVTSAGAGTKAADEARRVACEDKGDKCKYQPAAWAPHPREKEKIKKMIDRLKKKRWKSQQIEAQDRVMAQAREDIKRLEAIEIKGPQPIRQHFINTTSRARTWGHFFAGWMMEGSKVTQTTQTRNRKARIKCILNQWMKTENISIVPLIENFPMHTVDTVMDPNNKLVEALGVGQNMMKKSYFIGWLIEQVFYNFPIDIEWSAIHARIVELKKIKNKLARAIVSKTPEAWTRERSADELTKWKKAFIQIVKDLYLRINSVPGERYNLGNQRSDYGGKPWERFYDSTPSLLETQIESFDMAQGKDKGDQTIYEDLSVAIEHLGSGDPAKDEYGGYFFRKGDAGKCDLSKGWFTGTIFKLGDVKVHKLCANKKLQQANKKYKDVLKRYLHKTNPLRSRGRGAAWAHGKPARSSDGDLAGKEGLQIGWSYTGHKPYVMFLGGPTRKTEKKHIEEEEKKLKELRKVQLEIAAETKNLAKRAADVSKLATPRGKALVENEKKKKKLGNDLLTLKKNFNKGRQNRWGVGPWEWSGAEPAKPGSGLFSGDRIVDADPNIAATDKAVATWKPDEDDKIWRRKDASPHPELRRAAVLSGKPAKYDKIEDVEKISLLDAVKEVVTATTIYLNNLNKRSEEISRYYDGKWCEIKQEMGSDKRQQQTPKAVAYDANAAKSEREDKGDDATSPTPHPCNDNKLDEEISNFIYYISQFFNPSDEAADERVKKECKEGRKKEKAAAIMMPKCMRTPVNKVCNIKKPAPGDASTHRESQWNIQYVFSLLFLIQRLFDLGYLTSDATVAAPIVDEQGNWDVDVPAVLAPPAPAAAERDDEKAVAIKRDTELKAYIGVLDSFKDLFWFYYLIKVCAQLQVGRKPCHNIVDCLQRCMNPSSSSGIDYRRAGEGRLSDLKEPMATGVAMAKKHLELQAAEPLDLAKRFIDKLKDTQGFYKLWGGHSTDLNFVWSGNLKQGTEAMYKVVNNALSKLRNLEKEPELLERPQLVREAKALRQDFKKKTSKENIGLELWGRGRDGYSLSRHDVIKGGGRKRKTKKKRRRRRRRKTRKHSKHAAKSKRGGTRRRKRKRRRRKTHRAH